MCRSCRKKSILMHLFIIYVVDFTVFLLSEMQPTRWMYSTKKKKIKIVQKENFSTLLFFIVDILNLQLTVSLITYNIN